MSVLRKALEGIEAEPPTDQTASIIEPQNELADQKVVMSGPLSEIYTNALNIAYAKPDPETGKVILESQAIDATIMQNLDRAMQTGAINMHSPTIVDPATPPTDSYQAVYGVSRDELTDETIVDVTKELANLNDSSEYVMIIDGTQPGVNGTGAPVERIETITAALECMVIAHGGRVFHSLSDYVKTRK